MGKEIRQLMADQLRAAIQAQIDAALAPVVAEIHRMQKRLSEVEASQEKTDD